jgi:hypothetical protein
MFSWIEFGLAVAAVLVGCAAPRLGISWFDRAERILDRLAQRRWLAAGTVGVSALVVRAALLFILPFPQPGVEDEFGHLLLADTFAHGRLTNPTHPLWVHFETFFVIWQPTYTAKFWPAQGLIMALGQRILGHPFWGVWLSIGVMCAAICWMLQGWLPPGWALVGGILAVIRLGTFSYWANSYWGGSVAATGGALVLGALPRVKRSRRWRDSLLMGLGFAILANSRPYEGVFLGMPVAWVLARWTFGKRRMAPGPAGTQALDPPPRAQVENDAASPPSVFGEAENGGWWKSVVAPLLLAVVLTGCAMSYYFWRTTGSPWQSPYLVYERTYDPAPYFPWQSLRSVPAYHHDVMRDSYRQLVADQYTNSRSPGRMITTDLTILVVVWGFYLGPILTLPWLVALVTLPYGFSWRDISGNTRFLALACGSVIAGVMLPGYFFPHYAAPITAAIMALVLQAMRRVRSVKGPGKATGLFITRTVPLVCLFMLLLRVAAKPLHLPEPRRFLIDGQPSWCALTPTNTARAAMLAELKRRPGRQLAIVRYGPHHVKNYSEWVFNEADIDGAKVVWARDMGSGKNQELIDYYKDREAWLVEADEEPPRVLPYGTSASR